MPLEVVAGIGLAAAIAGLIQFVEPMVKNLGPTQHGKDDLNGLILTLKTLNSSHDALVSFVESNHEQQSTILWYLREPNTRCIEVLAILENRLKKHNFVDRLIVGAKWDKKFDKYMKILDDARGCFDLAIQVDQYKTSNTALTKLNDHIKASTLAFQEISVALDLNSETLAGISDEITTWKDEVQVEEDEKLRKEIVRWLCNTDPGIDQNSAARKHQATTGSWFINGDIYQGWLRDPKFIWVQGMAGCGKTILCSSIVTATQQHCKEIGNAALAYFYFSFADVKKQNVQNFIRSILGQFVHQMARTPSELKDLYKTHMHSTPPVKVLVSVLEVIMQLPGERFIIVDALDECNLQDGERDELCEHLKHLASHKKLHILATSRKEADLEDGLAGSKGLVTMPIRNPQVDADIRLYVQSELDNNPKFQRMKWLSKVKDDILQTLENESYGMFRWAFCQLETIKTACHNVKEVHETLRGLPKNLDDTYKRILEGISDDHRQRAVIALQWLAFSNRPLTIKELAEAAIIDPAQDPAFDIDNRFEDPLDIMRILSSLVMIQTQSTWQQDSVMVYEVEPDADNFIILAHFSIKEYLLSKRILSAAPEFAMKPNLAHRLLLESCLRYNAYMVASLDETHHRSETSLSSGSMEDIRTSDVSGAPSPTSERGEERNRPDAPNQLTGPDQTLDAYDELDSHSIFSEDSNCTCLLCTFPLLKYSRVEWVRHKDDCVLDTKMNNLVFEVLVSPSWRLLWDPDSPCIDLMEKALSRASDCPLLQAAYFDLFDVCSKILDTGADPNQRLSGRLRASTILEEVLEIGHYRIAKLLIDAGSDVNWAMDSEDKPITSRSLCLSVHSGRADLVQLLLQAGAETASQTVSRFFGKNRVPLEVAAETKRWNLFNMMVDNTKGVDLTQALGLTAVGGNWEIFEELLKAGANVKNVLLGLKMKQTTTEVVKSLLEYGADADARGGEFGSAMQQVATLCGSERKCIMELLLEHGANSNVQHEDEETCALTGGKSPLQIILLDQGVYTTYIEEETIQCVKLLLDKGAHVHPPGNEDWSSLQRIINILKEGSYSLAIYTKLVVLLLDHGAILDSTTEPEFLKAKDYQSLAELFCEAHPSPSTSRGWYPRYRPGRKPRFSYYEAEIEVVENKHV